MKHPLSFALVIRHEDATIEGCLNSILPYADEIVVLHQREYPLMSHVADSADDGATTLAVLRWKLDHPEVTLRYRVAPFKGVCELYRQQSIDHCAHPWVFVIDADERLPAGIAFDPLVDWAEENGIGVVGFPRRNHVVDFPSCTLDEVLGDDWQFRLVKQGAVRWPAEVHSQPTPLAGTSRAQRRGWAIDHLWYFSAQPGKMRRYTASAPNAMMHQVLNEFHRRVFNQFKVSITKQLRARGNLDAYPELEEISYA